MWKHGVIFLIFKWSQWNSLFSREEEKRLWRQIGRRRVLQFFADFPKTQITRKRRLNCWILPCFLACVWKFVGWKSKLCLWVRRAFKFTETGGYNFSCKERKRQKANIELASNILAKRLENVLPKIIHFDESAFVKGRATFYAIRTTDNVIEHTMNRDISGILVAIDSEKAFDSLNFNFLLRVLHAFNFGPPFI